MKGLDSTLRVAAAIAIAAAAAGCADDVGVEEEVEATDEAIVGGVEAQRGAWPGTVALYKGSSQVCGGSLVAASWVVTAAHCVSAGSTTGGISRIVVGRHRLSSSEGEAITVKRAIRHPRYNSSRYDNDIALLELTRPAVSPRTKVVRTEQLGAVAPNANVTVVGWGATREGGSSSDVLREVSVPIIANPTCRTYSGYSSVTDNMICAGFTSGARDSCQGDSGGPLFLLVGAEKLQVGVVSWGIGCARARAPGVYTRLGNYLAWMKETSGGAIVSEPPPDDVAIDPGSAPPPPPPPPTFAGFAESGTVTRNQERAYAYDVPAGTYEVRMTGSGDADLHVRRNAPATTGSYDCRPYADGSNETCRVSFTAAGRLHVMVRGYASSSSYTVRGARL